MGQSAHIQLTEYLYDLRQHQSEQELRMLAADLKSEHSACLVCGGTEWFPVREGCDLCRPEYKKSFTLTRCSSCGQVSQNPIPDDRELDAAYSVSTDYVCYRPAWKESGWPVWKIFRSWTTSRRVARLKQHGTGHELLEVGCGAGDFMAAAHHAGWKVSAVEYNSIMAEMVRGEFGFDIRVGELAFGLWDDGHFDVVAFWNVLEHLQDPLRELLIAAHYLRPGGRVLLNIPSRQAAEQGQLFGQYWALLDLPRHIHFFDRATLSRLCEKAGLDVIVYETPFMQSAWCYYMSCWRWANRDGKKIARWPRFVAFAAGATLSLPYIALQARSKRGLEAFAVAVKH
jgi:SAM-dependent methyltransferase